MLSIEFSIHVFRALLDAPASPCKGSGKVSVSNQSRRTPTSRRVWSSHTASKTLRGSTGSREGLRSGLVIEDDDDDSPSDEAMHGDDDGDGATTTGEAGGGAQCLQNKRPSLYLKQFREVPNERRHEIA